MGRRGRDGEARGAVGVRAGTSFPAKALKASQPLRPEGWQGSPGRGGGLVLSPMSDTNQSNSGKPSKLVSSRTSLHHGLRSVVLVACPA